MGDSEALIVVRTPNWLGDTVLALPALQALRAARPAARVSLIGRWTPLLAGQGRLRAGEPTGHAACPTPPASPAI